MMAVEVVGIFQLVNIAVKRTATGTGWRTELKAFDFTDRNAASGHLAAACGEWRTAHGKPAGIINWKHLHQCICEWAPQCQIWELMRP